jgi:tetratricopeptide (TPR) repeat protein
MKNKTIFSFPFIAISILLMVMSGCTTTKNTPLFRGWHNMNARYNGYYYSRENNKEAIRKVEKEYKDDFTKQIPLFIYPTNETAKNDSALFNKTIKRSSTVIHRHAITTPKGKEEIANACKWIDENYMLIGIADFYKRDLFTALEVFTYCAQKYPDPLAKYKGMLWMIRADNEIGSLSLSEPIIDEIRNAEDFPKKKKAYMRDFAAVTADYYLKRNDQAQAIKALTELIAITKKKAVKARYIFVLAQLYESMGDTKNASTYFGMVPNLHPSYEMAFNAKINQAKLYDTELGDSKMMKRELMKMMKDGKNKEFLDQIYYALAQIVYKEKDIPLAISYLDKSILNSGTNVTQKALSFLKRADIYFEKTNYPAAELNYDSAMVFLPKDYPNYANIVSKKNSLNDLIANLKVITLEDSLQGLSKLSEKDRNRAIEKMIAKLEEDERKKAAAQQQQINNQSATAQNSTPMPSLMPATGAWYFYNPTTVSFGMNEFTKKWGVRKLENNWRRSEKEQESTSPDDQNNPTDSLGSNPVAVAQTISSSGVITDKSYYLKNIPGTPEAIVKSNNKIIEAYYNVGSIYKEQLSNNPKSAEALEDLLKRFPDNKFKLSSYYQLYRTYLSMNNTAKSDYYKNLLLNKYPDSEYAIIIRNPESGKDAKTSKSIVEKFYAETYQLYTSGKYLETISKCITADTAYSKNYLMPQFDLLKAMSIGRTQDVDAFEKALTNVTVKYPKSPIKAKAQEMLDAIRNQKLQNAPPAIVIDSTKKQFTFKDSANYFWMLIAEKGKADLGKLKTKLTTFNAQHPDNQKLIVSITDLDATHQMLTYQAFDGKTKAMEYYTTLKASKDLNPDLEADNNKVFVISSDNYQILVKDKQISEYQSFFSQNFQK